MSSPDTFFSKTGLCSHLTRKPLLNFVKVENFTRTLQEEQTILKKESESSLVTVGSFTSGRPIDARLLQLHVPRFSQ